MDYSIESFWKPKFAGLIAPKISKPRSGWLASPAHEQSFVQARMSLREGFDNLQETVWLVAAPGAVGKSTLAKEICASVGAVYLDLASAATVAGNYLVGGFAHTDLLTSWTEGRTAIFVDALDEARLRITQSGFEAFLSDVAEVSRMGKLPIVLLGRVGIIEEAWTVLSENNGVEAPIFEIELFNLDEARAFVFSRLQKFAKDTDSQERFIYPHLAKALQTHGPVYTDVIARVLDGLQKLSSKDGNRFVGYAPVLDAVAKVIASETNQARINDELEKVLQGEVLSNLAREILLREKTKLLTQLQATIPHFPTEVYGPAEQLTRLGARIFGGPQPALPSQLAQDQVAAYEQAIDGLLRQHPFLDGNGAAPSSAVFAAAIVAAALKSSDVPLRRLAERFASSSAHTPNPFLFDFYISKTGQDELPTEHIGLIFESVLAKSEPGEIVSLSVEGDENHPTLAVEISVEHDETSQTTRMEFASPASGTLRLGRRVASVSIDAEATDVEIGSGDQLELVAPVQIASKSLTLLCGQVIVKPESGLNEDSTVILEASELLAEPSMGAPIVRPGVVFQVSWPEANAYPWTSFAGPTSVDESPRTTEALRALRRLTMAFRSHSKGDLARFKDKIEHQRMLKGPIGEALLKKLMADGVISLRGPKYYLDPVALGAKVGASYLSVKLKLYSDQTRAYVQSVA